MGTILATAVQKHIRQSFPKFLMALATAVQAHGSSRGLTEVLLWSPLNPNASVSKKPCLDIMEPQCLECVVDFSAAPSAT